MMKRLSLSRLLLGRRKILRLYRLTPLSLLLGNYMILCVANLSIDAKSCVYTGEDAPFIEAMKCLSLPRFSTRETQNIASLLADAANT